MKFDLSFLIPLTSFLILSSDGANILVFVGQGTYSHKLSIWPLVTALADKGHNVTCISGFEKQPRPNPRVNDLFSPAIQEMIQSVYKVDRVQDRLEGAHTKLFGEYNQAVVKSCEDLMATAKTDPVLHYIVHEAEFDLVINNMILGECGVLIAHQKKAKLILFVSANFISWFHDEFGFPDEPAVVPDMATMAENSQFPMSYWKRAVNFWSPISWFLDRRLNMYPKLEEIMRMTYNLETAPSFAEIYQSTDLILSASHYSTDFARSVPPFFVPIGGMQCWEPFEPLSGEFKTVLDKAVNGAVLIAFGSTVNLATLPPSIKSSFFSMMQSFPEITFIWRWDGPEPEIVPKNLILSKWLPQFQILGHPNLKAFISHAGLNSLSEATYHGKPVILVPLFADQDYNGYRIQQTEIGIRLEVREITHKLLVDSVNDVFKNPKYSKNMRMMSALFKDRPMNPIETAVYWTEFVLRHESTAALKPLQNLNFFQRRQFDVLLVFFVVTTIFFFFLSASVLYLIRKIIFAGSTPIKTQGSAGQIKKKRN